jgi:hypothetical protein
MYPGLHIGARVTSDTAINPVRIELINCSYAMSDTILIPNTQVFSASSVAPTTNREAVVLHSQTKWDRCFTPPRFNVGNENGLFRYLQTDEDCGIFSSGGRSQRNVTINSNNYELFNEDSTVMIDASAGNRTVFLPNTPPLTTADTPGRIYTIKKIDDTTNTVTIQPQAGELIDGQATLTLKAPNDVVIIQNNGVHWFVISCCLTSASNGGIPIGIMPVGANRVQYHLRQSGYLVIQEGVQDAATNNVGAFNGSGTGNKAFLTIENDPTDTSLVGTSLDAIVAIRCRARGILRGTGTDFNFNDVLYLNLIVDTSGGPRILVANQELGNPDLPLTTAFNTITFDPSVSEWGIVGGPEFGLNNQNLGPGLPLIGSFIKYATATLDVISTDGGAPAGTPVGPIIFTMGSSNTLEPRRIEFEWVEYETAVGTFRYSFI